MEEDPRVQRLIDLCDEIEAQEAEAQEAYQSASQPGRWFWFTLQIGIFLTVSFSNIYFEWGVDGAAISVMGGMAAWYVTRIIVAVIDSRHKEAGLQQERLTKPF